MRVGSAIACLLATTLAGAAFAGFKTIPLQAPPSLVQAPRVAPRSHLLSFSSLTAEIDSQVIANLLADLPTRRNDLPLTVVAGEITRCEAQTCSVPLTVRVGEAGGPVTLAFAVANEKGELSEVHHVECGTGSCGVSLIVEQGRNTISVGVIDAVGQATATTMLRVNAVRNIARAGKTEWF